MTFGVFIHRSDSIYDDRLAERYQFPGQYRRRVEACIGSWIIYYEPRKIRGTRGYFAVAKVTRVIPDPNAPGMFIAAIGQYLPFVNPVPFAGPDGVVERSVLNEAGRISGRAQSAVRPISDTDFHRIVGLGLAGASDQPPRVGDPAPPADLQEEQEKFNIDQTQDRARYLTSRTLRDRVFRQIVVSAYDARCAVTGLRLINGGGRAEVEAAHIRPVEADGPDIVSNGLALSGTAHWMFDRGLIGVADDMRILVSRHINDPDGVRSMINATGCIASPARPSDRPHPAFLRWHRENCFKG